jgi:hypothetical protein
VPAEYTTITKSVLKTPEAIHTVEIPAEYAERDVVKMIHPPVEKHIPVPAECTEVENKVRRSGIKSCVLPIPLKPR